MLIPLNDISNDIKSGYIGMISFLGNGHWCQQPGKTHNPARVETPASKLKSSQRGLQNSLVLFKRTLVIRNRGFKPT
jgi:hypothetical protein